MVGKGRTGRNRKNELHDMDLLRREERQESRTMSRVLSGGGKRDNQGDLSIPSWKRGIKEEATHHQRHYTRKSGKGKGKSGDSRKNKGKEENERGKKGLGKSNTAPISIGHWKERQWARRSAKGS